MLENVNNWYIWVKGMQKFYYCNLYFFLIISKMYLKARQCGNNFKVLRQNHFEPKFYIQ